MNYLNRPDTSSPTPAASATSLVRAAVEALSAGTAMEALKAASEACHDAPDLPAAHYVYGQAWLALDRVAQAERAFAEAVRLAPTWADAWVNYGVARYRRGAVEDAKAAMRAALANAPGHRAATANLGAFLRITGEMEAASQLLRDSLARNPDEAGTRLNIVADLLQDGRSQEALALLDQAPPPSEPRAHAHGLSQRALALIQLGRTDEARAILDALGEGSADLAPLLLWRRLLLAAIAGDRAAARLLAERLAALLAEVGPAVPEHRIIARFDLGGFWAREKEPDRAFAQWAEGHRLLRPFQPFDRTAFQAFVDETIARFPAERFARERCAGDRDPAPVFVVGMPRSGTTLTEHILGTHAEAFSAGERLAMSEMAARLGGGLGGGSESAEAIARLAAVEPPMLDAAATHYLSELHALDPAAARVIDKMPGNFLYLGLVGLMLPGAKIIHCVRDPRDIGLSIFSFRFFGYHPYAHDLGDLGWYIGQHNRLMAHWRAVLPNPILTIALKDWVENFDATLRRALAFLELPYDPACERFYERREPSPTVSRAQVRRPINARGMGRWRPYEKHLKPLIEALAAAGVPLPTDLAETGAHRRD